MTAVDPVVGRRNDLGNNGVVKFVERRIPAEVAGQQPDRETDHGPQRVASSLLSDGPATVTTLAARLGVSATAVRRHLDALEQQGLVVGDQRPPYGPAPRRGRGRPARVFALTAAGRDTFATGYDALAVAALQFLAHDTGDDGVAAFAKAQADNLAADVLDRLGPGWDTEPEPQRLDALAGALSDLGFAASIAPSPVGVQLCQHNCPVSHVAERFPQLCEAETEVIAGLVGHHVQRIATIANGAGVCTTVIPTSAVTRRGDDAQSTQERTIA